MFSTYFHYLGIGEDEKCDPRWIEGIHQATAGIEWKIYKLFRNDKVDHLVQSWTHG